MNYCYRCGTQLNPQDTHHCPSCGAVFSNRKKSNFTLIFTTVFLLIMAFFYAFVWPAITTNIAKPMIYIYPKEEMDVSIKLGNPELLTTTYPLYNNGWNVHAKPDGTLIYNNREYYGLYWEGIKNTKSNPTDGFVVAKEDTISFLEEKLSILGLNDREANEFIVYWLPILEENNYNLIRFQDIDTINKEMPLIIEPEPDTLIRVIMEYKPLKKKINIKEQELTKVERKGFTVVEWGGTQIN